MEDKQNRKRERGRTYIIWAARLLILLCFVLVTLFVGQHLPGRNNIQLSSGTLDSSGEYYNNNKNPGDSSMEEEKTYSTNAPLIKVNTDPLKLHCACKQGLPYARGLCSRRLGNS